MKSCFAIIGSLFIVIVLSIGLSWVFTGNGFAIYSVFAPKVESVRRNVFKQSQAYNDGMVNDLQSLRLDYVKSSDPQAKDAIASVIIQRSGSFTGDMPGDLRDFIQKLKEEKGL